MRPTPRTRPTRARTRPLAAAVLCVAAFGFSGTARGQLPRSGEGIAGGSMTIVSSPPDAVIALRGSSDLLGMSPLELGREWSGRYRVTLQAPGYALGTGTLLFPADGTPPRAVSEPTGVSGRLLARSLLFPGTAALLDHRTPRGIALLTAGVGGLGAVIRDHVEYGDKKDKPDLESQGRAQDFKYARGQWAAYTGAVWAWSALDNILRPRIDVVESTPNRVTIRGSKLSRSGVLVRSALVPGAGQESAGKSLRGSLWLGATLLSGAAYMTAKESHHRIETKLGQARELLASAAPAEVADRQADVDHFVDLEDRSSRLTDNLALTTVAIYAANIIDAGFVALGEGAAISKMSLSPPVGIRPGRVALTFHF